MNVYDAKGKSIGLGASVGRGGEAVVYKVSGKSGWLAKIYEPSPRANYAHKLTWMLEHPPGNPTHQLAHPSLAWPAGLLYDSNRQLIGYLMPYIQSAVPALEVFNPRRRAIVLPRFDRRYLHRAARNLAASLKELHSSGYVIGDLNESNILITPSALVTLIDTDSFQVQEQRSGHVVVHPCPVGKLEYTPPELQRQAMGKVYRKPEHDAFGLGVLIFQLLMEGNHPFRAQWLGGGEPPPIEARIAQGGFPYVSSPTSPVQPPKNAPNINLLHPGIVELVRRCFIDGHQEPELRPDPDAWERAIAIAEKALIICPNGHVFSNHLRYCPACPPTARGRSERSRTGWGRGPAVNQQPSGWRANSSQGAGKQPASNPASKPMAAGFPTATSKATAPTTPKTAPQPAARQAQPARAPASPGPAAASSPSSASTASTQPVSKSRPQPTKSFPWPFWPASPGKPKASKQAPSPGSQPAGQSPSPGVQPPPAAASKPSSGSAGPTPGFRPAWSAPQAGAPRYPVNRPTVTSGSVLNWMGPKIYKSIAIGGGLGALAGILPGAVVSVASASAGNVAAWGLLWAFGGAAGGMLVGWKPWYRLSQWVNQTIGWHRFWQGLGLVGGAFAGGLAGLVLGWWAIFPVFIGLFYGAKAGVRFGRKIWESGNRLGWERILTVLGAGGAALFGWMIARWIGFSVLGSMSNQMAGGLSSWILEQSISLPLAWAAVGALGGALGGAIAGIFADLFGRFTGLVD